MLKKKFLFLLSLVFSQIVIGQETQNSLYNWFDKEIGKQNLDVNNGLLFHDIYPTDKKTNRFFDDEKFHEGEIEFDNQNYTLICINYDLLGDALLIKPYCESNRNSLIAIKDKIKSFIFKGKKFVNLNYNENIKNHNVDGYYEEVLTNKEFQFYTKYKKNKREFFADKSILFEYELRNDYVLFYKNSFHKVDSKKSITKLFPEFKTQINNFFQQNNQLLTSNKTVFLKNLFNYIIGLK